jgi:GT2 family glycosyltransferase
MRISAVILSFNSARYLGRCIRGLATALTESGGPNEIWVVENGSTDGSAEVLRGLQEEYSGLLRVIYLDRNVGTTASRNMAVGRSAGRRLLIMDSDVEVPLGTLGPLLARLDTDPACGLVAPRLVYPDGRLQMSTDVFPTVPRKLRRFLALKRMERANVTAGSSQGPRDVDYVISAFWLLRRDVVDAVGPLDENIFYSPEDVDYCLRVWAAGYTVVYDPTVYAVHDAQEISRGFRVKEASLSHAKGLAYLFWKHRYALTRRGLYRRIGRRTPRAFDGSACV